MPSMRDEADPGGELIRGLAFGGLLLVLLGAVLGTGSLPAVVCAFAGIALSASAAGTALARRRKRTRDFPPLDDAEEPLAPSRNG
ncbi:hypothetical protein IQ251_18910 [Saccharopolyspora sp. HNM0983]|uniref:Uncharacterized protein n=1 Tax=Saccharopolyspora montiporae TaxID=2781240 RepID=A0A929BEF0_9PSEU|nr:hypothetical protein [Saccharopolyspora sp. HNM0983]MBE9376526.1 hypothetical protein [Saccharopolyspora sp. HNM0983]